MIGPIPPFLNAVARQRISTIFSSEINKKKCLYGFNLFRQKCLGLISPPQFLYPPQRIKIVKSLFWNENGERGDVCELVLGVGLVYNTRI
jgi:hypothetical protein